MFEKYTVFKACYREIESLIDAHFKNENHKDGFELPCIEERGSGNGEDWEISIKKEKIGEYDLETLKEVEQGKWPMYSTQILMTELCNREVIPEGNYLIDISW